MVTIGTLMYNHTVPLTFVRKYGPCIDTDTAFIFVLLKTRITASPYIKYILDSLDLEVQI